MRQWKTLSRIFVTALITACAAFPALAATNYEVIDEITLDISSNIYAGENGSDVDVSTDTEGCYVDSVSVTNEPDNYWDEDDKPKLTIVLYVTDEDEYRFDTEWSKKDVYLEGDGGTVTSVSDSNSRKKLTVKVTLDELDYSEDFDEDEALEIYDLYWDDETGEASWEENEYAKRYEVRLYRNGSAVTSTLKTTDNDYNFAEYFTKKGDYTFKVRVVRSSSTTGSWYESEELSVDSEEAAAIRSYASSGSSSSGSSSSGSAGSPGASTTAGAWLRDNVGWWWCNPDKTYPVSAWKYINNRWYYFDGAGYCVQNKWVQTNGIWYYCGPDGDMWTNTWTPDGYRVGADGAWIR